MTHHEDDSLPRAAHIEPSVCDCCGSVVLTLYGKDGASLAWASIDTRTWFDLCNAVNDEMEQWIASRAPPPAELQ